MVVILWAVEISAEKRIAWLVGSEGGTVSSRVNVERGAGVCGGRETESLELTCVGAFVDF